MPNKYNQISALRANKTGHGRCNSNRHDAVNWPLIGALVVGVWLTIGIVLYGGKLSAFMIRKHVVQHSAPIPSVPASAEVRDTSAHTSASKPAPNLVSPVGIKSSRPQVVASQVDLDHGKGFIDQPHDGLASVQKKKRKIKAAAEKNIPIRQEKIDHDPAVNYSDNTPQQ